MAELSNHNQSSVPMVPQIRPLPPGYDKHHVVYLEAIHVPLPDLDFPYTLTSYPNTTPSQIAERISTATIVISTVVPVTKADLSGAPHLQCLTIFATGMAWVDREYCASRGITVLNCPQSNIDAVTEHFLGLYLASRKRIPMVDHSIKHTTNWVDKTSLTKTIWPDGPPLGIKQETLGIVGYGSLGRNIRSMMESLGVRKVLVAERRDASTIREGRVSFNEMLISATTIVVVCPRSPSTTNLIDTPEFDLMRRDALLVNVARGGIVNEFALANALKRHKIFGAATDVFDEEPSGPGRSPLLPASNEEEVPNLIVSGHVAWHSGRTVEILLSLMKLGLERFVEGRLYDEDVAKCIAVHDGRVWKW